MNKIEFITKLEEKLQGLPRADVYERLNFYSEMIDDRVEEGFSEEEAVKNIGTVEEVSAQIIGDIPFVKIAKEKIKNKSELKGWEIAVLTLGAPLWIPLVIATVAVLFSFYIVTWALVISLWAVFIALLVCFPFGVFACIVFAINGNGVTGLMLLGGGTFVAGVGLTLFFVCKEATKGTAVFGKKVGLGIKKLFIK